MNKLQGKVKAIPAKKVTKGMQIIFKPTNKVVKVYKVCKSLTIDNILLYTLDNKFYGSCYLAGLKTLVVEYREPSLGMDGYTVTKQLPLKYSQWQSAIENGEVDSDKVVEFEKITGVPNKPFEFCYAKIISQKQKMYSEEEVLDLIETLRFPFEYNVRKFIEKQAQQWLLDKSKTDYHIYKNKKY